MLMWEELLSAALFVALTAAFMVILLTTFHSNYNKSENWNEKLPACYLYLPSKHDGIGCIFKAHYIGILYRGIEYICKKKYIPDNASSKICCHMTCLLQAE